MTVQTETFLGEIREMRKTFMMTLIVVSTLLFALISHGKEASGEKTGESLFKEHCAACHPNGSNVLNPQKTLHKKDLEANNITTAADIVRKMRNPGPFPTHPQEWAGMRMFDERTIPDDDALKIADYILKTFK
jgi:cytochrome c6